MLGHGLACVPKQSYIPISTQTLMEKPTSLPGVRKVEKNVPKVIAIKEGGICVPPTKFDEGN